jgi:hypothetical protein
MLSAVKFAILVLVLAGTCRAQDGLTIDNQLQERVSTPEAEKIYSSACAVVQREFGFRRALHPQVRLVLGADKNEVWFAGRIATLSHRESFGLPLRT